MSFLIGQVYYPVYARFGGETVKKTLVIFLAKLKSDPVEVRDPTIARSLVHLVVQINVTEHVDFEWMKWNSPPIAIQSKSVDPLVKAVHQHLNQS